MSMAADRVLNAQEMWLGGEEIATGVHSYLEAHIVGGIPLDKKHLKEIRMSGIKTSLTESIPE